MAVPKRKTTPSKRNMRRSHHRVKSINIVEDKKSGEYRLISSCRFKNWLL